MDMSGASEGREPPVGHVGTPEAAEVLGVTQQSVRNYVRAGTLKGERVIEPNGDTRYWVDIEDLERLRSEREIQKGEIAEVIGGELTQSRQIMLDQILGRLEASDQRIVDAIVDQKDELRRAIEQQRQQVLRELRALQERQTGISADLHAAVELLRAEAERHAEQVEREKQFQARTLEIQEQWSEGGGRTPLGRYWGFLILALTLFIVVLLLLIVLELFILS
jgi:DNA-binding transcriptional MerR regulator